MKESALKRVGVIGTGRIANRFMVEVRYVADIQVRGVYNPHRKSAVRFGEKWGIQAYASFTEFLENIDIVYVATPHETHYAYTKEALLHGKHVLCEKPMVLQKAQAQELYSYARRYHLVLMEGIKTCYCPCFQKVLGVAHSGRIGHIRNVEACFTKLEDPKKRELTDALFGGSFRELGSYVLMPIVKIFGTSPSNMQFESLYDERGIDLFTKVSLSYTNEMATSTCGLGVKSDGRLLMSGTKGYILVPAPWWLTSYFEVHYQDPNHIERYQIPFLGDGLRYEISELLSRMTCFSESSREQSMGLTEQESIALAGFMEAFSRANPHGTRRNRHDSNDARTASPVTANRT